MNYLLLAIIPLLLSFLLTAFSDRIQKVLDSRFTYTGKEWLRYAFNLNETIKSYVITTYHRAIGSELWGSYGGIVEYMIIYPIKSVGSGVKVTEWELSSYGFKGDRQYMIAYFDKDKGYYTKLSLKDHQKLALVKVRFDEKSRYFNFTCSESSFSLPIEMTEELVQHYSSCPSTEQKISFYTSTMRGYVLDKILPRSFIDSMELPEEAVLICTTDGKPCTVGVPKKEKRSTIFQDYYPILMCSEASYESVKEEVGEDVGPLQMYSFRPNLVIEDTKPFAEDSYFEFDIVGDASRHRFRAPIKCIRCNFPNVDYKVGKFDKKARVTRALSRFRRVDEKYPRNTCFGKYVVNLEEGFKVRKGDKLDVVLKRIDYWRENPFRAAK
ncbi:DEKNAAC104223 [Brettanomyces naardenensis]|uniref:DEKNAAC104223 n=1 Tax=Brettanomyces naardenensis TaxID=13370 RepID=A0A448YQC8_BRENA|nr:DEKNAAC104223 [Brettanomyces naardenensis]